MIHLVKQCKQISDCSPEEIRRESSGGQINNIYSLVNSH